MLAHRTRVQAHVVGTWQEQLVGTPKNYNVVIMLCVCRVFEPRYRRLVKCCQETNGCFALACYGVGISAMFDRVHAEEDASNSVTIRGGRRFLVQEGSARVVPGTFGLTVVEPTYIYVRLCLAQVHPACNLLHVFERAVAV